MWENKTKFDASTCALGIFWAVLVSSFPLRVHVRAEELKKWAASFKQVVAELEIAEKDCKQADG